MGEVVNESPFINMTSDFESLIQEIASLCFSRTLSEEDAFMLEDLMMLTLENEFLKLGYALINTKPKAYRINQYVLMLEH